VTGAIRIVGGVVLYLTGLALASQLEPTPELAQSAIAATTFFVGLGAFVWGMQARAQRRQIRAVEHELYTEAMADQQHRLDLEYWHARAGSNLETRP
jgi:cell division septation protein DedD